MQTAADAEARETCDKLALYVMQDAFHLNTQDINSKDYCRLVDLAFMQRIAEGA